MEIEDLLKSAIGIKFAEPTRETEPPVIIIVCEEAKEAIEAYRELVRHFKSTECKLTLIETVKTLNIKLTEADKSAISIHNLIYSIEEYKEFKDKNYKSAAFLVGKLSLQGGVTLLSTTPDMRAFEILVVKLRE